MKKIVLLTVLALILVFSVGCSAPYEVLEPVDRSSMTIETGVGIGVSADYDAGEWFFDGSGTLGSYQLYDMDYTDINQVMSINFAMPNPSIAGLEIDSIAKIFELQMASMGNEVLTKEIKVINDTEIIYFESVVVMNDEMLDLMLEQGIITEQQIEDMGGRDYLKSTPPTNQVSMMQVIDDEGYMFSGTYFSESDKELVVDALTLIMETLEVTQ